MFNKHYNIRKMTNCFSLPYLNNKYQNYESVDGISAIERIKSSTTPE
jgi:hypothetical protein